MSGLGKKRSKLGNWIDSRGISQTWLAEKAGVNRNTVSRVCNEDDESITLKNMRKILVALRTIDPNAKAEDFWDL